MNATYISSKAEKHEDELPSVFCDADLLNMSNVDLCRLIQTGNKKPLTQYIRRILNLSRNVLISTKIFAAILLIQKI